ncbi:hypothetical protein COCON_G00168370 [Conger conger]|uniref:Uncharacterized protein n=1 Tax=Conger conger TaxID=82655 RepID=A0A9Q1D825_CONCO|nr:hypothetical protein COCON_G00168370 [Conger conger]
MNLESGCKGLKINVIYRMFLFRLVDMKEIGTSMAVQLYMYNDHGSQGVEGHKPALSHNALPFVCLTVKEKMCRLRSLLIKVIQARWREGLGGRRTVPPHGAARNRIGSTGATLSDEKMSGKSA